jgi:hypothetical protein
VISFFKAFDPLRIIALLCVLLIIRLPMMISGTPLLVPELDWMLIGERMNMGFGLYKDIWDTIEPLSAGVYFILNKLFGKSQLSYQIITLLLIYFQALLFNLIININNLFNERTLIPGLLYIIFSSLFFDFLTLSPMFMGITFLMLALHFLFIQMRSGLSDESIFYTGLFTGIASLFCLPLSVFLFMVMISFLLFTGLTLRKCLILFVSFLFPGLIASVYFLCNDSLGLFIMNYFLPLFTMEKQKFISNNGILAILLIPGVLFAVSLFLISQKSKYINYQYNCLRVMGLWLVFGLIVITINIQQAPYQLLIFAPGLAYFCTHYFILVKSRLIRELTFLFSAVLILTLSYGGLYNFVFKKKPVDYDKMLVKSQGLLPAEIKDYKILVMGENFSYYDNNKAATPYLNWKLSLRHFSDLDNYYNLSQIYEYFQQDMPEVIIDERGLAESLFSKIPPLKEKYRKMEGTNIYFRR